MQIIYPGEHITKRVKYNTKRAPENLAWGFPMQRKYRGEHIVTKRVKYHANRAAVNLTRGFPMQITYRGEHITKRVTYRTRAASIESPRRSRGGLVAALGPPR